jgi:hypothetical protein
MKLKMHDFELEGKTSSGYFRDHALPTPTHQAHQAPTHPLALFSFWVGWVYVCACTSARSFGFCASWVCISSSTSLKGKHPVKRTTNQKQGGGFKNYLVKYDRQSRISKSAISRKASRLATEEDKSECFPSYRWLFFLECQCFLARIYCNGQYFYWAAS